MNSLKVNKLNEGFIEIKINFWKKLLNLWVEKENCSFDIDDYDDIKILNNLDKDDLNFIKNHFFNWLNNCFRHLKKLNTNKDDLLKVNDSKFLKFYFLFILINYHFAYKILLLWYSDELKDEIRYYFSTRVYWIILDLISYSNINIRKEKHNFFSWKDEINLYDVNDYTLLLFKKRFNIDLSKELWDTFKEFLENSSLIFSKWYLKRLLNYIETVPIHFEIRKEYLQWGCSLKLEESMNSEIIFFHFLNETLIFIKERDYILNWQEKKLFFDLMNENLDEVILNWYFLKNNKESIKIDLFLRITNNFLLEIKKTSNVDVLHFVLCIHYILLKKYKKQTIYKKDISDIDSILKLIYHLMNQKCFLLLKKDFDKRKIIYSKIFTENLHSKWSITKELMKVILSKDEFNIKSNFYWFQIIKQILYLIIENNQKIFNKKFIEEWLKEFEEKWENFSKIFNFIMRRRINYSKNEKNKIRDSVLNNFNNLFSESLENLYKENEIIFNDKDKKRIEEINKYRLELYSKFNDEIENYDYEESNKESLNFLNDIYSILIILNKKKQLNFIKKEMNFF